MVLQVNLRQLEKQRAGLTHYTLLDVEVGQLFQRTNLLRSELGDALVNGDGFCKETITDKNLREAFEVIDGLERLALADVQLADGHQGDLIARLVLQNMLVFSYGLGDLALVQQLLCGFNVLALVIGHARTETNLPLESAPDFLLNFLR